MSSGSVVRHATLSNVHWGNVLPQPPASTAGGCLRQADMCLAPLALHRPAGGEARETGLAEFFEKWKHEPLVILKWITIQVGRHGREGTRGRKGEH